MQGSQKPLYIWGPVGLRAWIECQLQGTFSALRYPLYIVELLLRKGQSAVIWETDRLYIEAFPLDHGVPTLGFIFREKCRGRRLDKEKFIETGLPEESLVELRTAGRVTYQGREYWWEDVSFPPPPSRSFAYCSDTLYDPSLVDFVSGVTVLYHEATFASEHIARAQQTFHSTAREAALLAKAAHAKRLYIGHFSTRYRNLHPLLEEARSIFPETYLVEEGQVYPISEG
jgi:ribonuclease Z